MKPRHGGKRFRFNSAFWSVSCMKVLVFTAMNLSYAFRTLKRSPVFTLIVLASLALGIGSNAAIFSVVNALFLHPAGIDQPDRVVAPRISYKKLGLDRIEMSLPDFVDVRESRTVFSSAAGMNIVGLNYTSGDSPQRLQAAATTWQWFDVLGAKPLLGRGFKMADDQPGANHVVVLSFDMWRRMFGAQRSVLGTTMELDRKPYRIVGVMPANFRWPSQADIWVPLGLPATAYAESHRFDEFFTVVARLRPDVSFAQCKQFMGVLSRRAKTNKDVAVFANESQWSMQVETVNQLISGDLKDPLLVLSAAVGLVLLIACSNIAGLMLVRASGKSRELALRSALGASMRNLVGQAMTESLLLAFGGTVLGILSISVLLKGLLALAPARITLGLVIKPDVHVVLFTIAAGALAAVLFGLMPSWQAARFGNQFEALKEGGRSDTAGVNKQRARSALVVGQVAVALVLLVGAGLLLKSLERLRSANLGFNPSHLMTAAVALPDAAYHDQAKQVAMYRSVIEDLKTKPGVITAAAAEPVPFNGDHWTGSFQIEGRPDLPGDPGPHGYRGYISPRYFDALRIPILEGRAFTDADRMGTQPVTIIDENLARKYWPHGDAIGKRLRNTTNLPWATVVGVVKHIKAYSFDPGDTRGIYYMPIYQWPVSNMNFLVRTAGNPHAMAAVIAQAVHSQDPSQAVFDLATPLERIDKALGPQEFAMKLLSLFAGAALLLAAIGLYGVISFSAGRRTREIGIRSALGASRWEVITMIARQGFRLTLLGLVFGCAIAGIAVKGISSSFEYASLDWSILLLAMLLLSFVALVAALVPAWRATHIDPLSALRSE